MRCAARSVIAASSIALAAIAAPAGCRRSLTADDAGTGVLPVGAGGAVGVGGAVAGVGGGAVGVGGDFAGVGGVTGDGTGGGAGGGPSGSCVDDAALSAIGEWAAWPMPNPASTGLPHPQSYTVAGDTVIDNVTRLVWQRSPMGGKQSIGVASQYCDGLVYGGRDDWRLPRAIDLLSLIDYTQTMPALNPVAFAPPMLGEFLSSTPAAPGSAARISVVTNAGYTSETATDDAVICVAGGCPVPTSSHYTAAGDVVRDMWTRLTWTRERAPGMYTLEEAVAYCAGLTIDGGGWRLPSLNELQSLLDRTQTAAPNINRQAFAETDTDNVLSIEYWTSSPVAGSNPPLQWLIGFYGGGLDIGASPVPPQSLRCVH